MIVCLDVDYRDGNTAAVAGIVFEKLNSDSIIEEQCVIVKDVHPYIPGEFYKRELPCLMAVLKEIKSPIDLIIVDSYVWLDRKTAGMGMYLYEELDEKIPVIGVAKTYFRGDDVSIQINRGISQNPLYITSVGLDKDKAVSFILNMHGENRIPTLLKKVDRLCRDAK